MGRVSALMDRFRVLRRGGTSGGIDRVRFIGQQGLLSDLML